MKRITDPIGRHSGLRVYFEGADHIDIKTIDSPAGLRPFIAGMLSCHPWWIRGLFRIREILVRLLGLTRHEMPAEPFRVNPEGLSFAPGGRAAFFTVRDAREDGYWVSEAPADKHLKAYFGVVTERTDHGMSRFHVFTSVTYRHWTGPVYFNLIRPFHHLVVWRMMQAGARADRPPPAGIVKEDAK